MVPRAGGPQAAPPACTVRRPTLGLTLLVLREAPPSAEPPFYPLCHVNWPTLAAQRVAAVPTASLGELAESLVARFLTPMDRADGGHLQHFDRADLHPDFHGDQALAGLRPAPLKASARALLCRAGGLGGLGPDRRSDAGAALPVGAQREAPPPGFAARAATKTTSLAVIADEFDFVLEPHRQRDQAPWLLVYADVLEACPRQPASGRSASRRARRGAGHRAGGHARRAPLAAAALAAAQRNPLATLAAPISSPLSCFLSWAIVGGYTRRQPLGRPACYTLSWPGPDGHRHPVGRLMLDKW